MQDRLNVQISFAVKTTEGADWFEANVKYADIKYKDVVAMQGLLVNGVLVPLLQWGQAAAEDGTTDIPLPATNAAVGNA